MKSAHETVVLTGQRAVLTPFSTEPRFRYNERALGFETDLLTLLGLSPDSITYHKVPNTRQSNPFIDQFVEAAWKKNAGTGAHDAPKARYEGLVYDIENEQITVRWSEERYSRHAGVKNTRLPRGYQANLLTFNGLLLPKDKTFPIFTRTEATDQPRIEHIAPVGFIEMKDGGDAGPLRPETIVEVTTRRLKAEFKFPEGAYDPTRLKVIGLAYNCYKNFDYDWGVVIPMDCDSSEMTSISEKHAKDTLRHVGTSQSALETELFKLAFAPDTNSGHLRADVAMLIGHLHGAEAYEEALIKTALKLNKMADEEAPTHV